MYSGAFFHIALHTALPCKHKLQSQKNKNVYKIQKYAILYAIELLLAHFFGMNGIWLSQTTTELPVLVVVLFEIHRCCIAFSTANHIDE